MQVGGSPGGWLGLTSGFFMRRGNGMNRCGGRRRDNQESSRRGSGRVMGSPQGIPYRAGRGNQEGVFNLGISVEPVHLGSEE